MTVVPKTLSPVAVTTAGTRVKISATPIYASSVIVEADSSNTGNVYLGDSAVSSSNGQTITKQSPISLTYDEVAGTISKIDLSSLYIDADTSGNKVRVFYFEWAGF